MSVDLASAKTPLEAEQAVPPAVRCGWSLVANGSERLPAAESAWMDQDWIVYIACIIGAVGVYLVLATRRPASGSAARGGGLRLLGGVIALAAFAWLLVRLASMAEEAAQANVPVLFYAFAFIAVAAAVRMISHSRPVYSALYFVMVVLSSAAVFLLLEAEFMAFALVIVYAGAILITYLFVLMLAQQTPTGRGDVTTAAEYDVNPHEPAAGVFVGFLLLALLGQVIFTSDYPMLPPAAAEARMQERVDEINRMDRKRAAIVLAFREAHPDLPTNSQLAAFDDEGVVFELPPAGRRVELTYAAAGLESEEIDDLLAQNIERVGMALVYKFPVSLELAGVILLLAMFGAVVLARKQIELSEDEKREAAGLRRLSVEPEESPHRVESVEDSKRDPAPRDVERGGEAR